MNNQELIRMIKAAKGETQLDLVITNGRIIDVYNHKIIEGKNIGILDGMIVGIGDYSNAKEIYDANGRYISPGFIDGHLHIESSHLCPEEMGRICVPHGTTTIIADPHEIVNVCGLDGMHYMLNAAKHTPLDIKYMLPSCVPATPFEHSGAIIDAQAMTEIITEKEILGLGEFMNYPGILNCDKSCIDKLVLCKNNHKFVDGHSPGLSGKELNAYTVAGVHDDHECSTIEEMDERITNGMYILLRQGSSCHDLEVLVKNINEKNEQRCLFCTDDKMANTIEDRGHIEEHLRICVKNGVDPIVAIGIATVNASRCFRIFDRGAIAPRKRADLVLIDNLTDFNVDEVFIEGKLTAKAGKFIPKVEKEDISSVMGSVHLKDFSVDKLKLNIQNSKVNAIKMKPGGIITEKEIVDIELDADGDFVFDKEKDICKVAVVERHKMTGNVANGILKGYGIKHGAIGVSMAHDSHNIIVAGTNNEDMACVVKSLEKIQGGISIVKDGKILYEFSMPISGLMTDESAEIVTKKLKEVDEISRKELGISEDVDPITTLSFMALPVIPDIKLTDIGLFDVTKFEFIDLEVK